MMTETARGHLTSFGEEELGEAFFQWVAGVVGVYREVMQIEVVTCKGAEQLSGTVTAQMSYFFMLGGFQNAASKRTVSLKHSTTCKVARLLTAESTS